MATDDDTTREEWRAIPDYPDYAVSDRGRVKRTTDKTCGKAGHLLKLRRGHRGHLTAQLWKNGTSKTITASRLMALAFYGPPPTPKAQAAHNDGIPSHNILTNVRWDSPAGNTADKRIHGTQLEGERHPQAVLTVEHVRNIRRLYAAAGYSLRVLGEAYGVHLSTISLIVRRKIWRGVEWQ